MTNINLNKILRDELKQNKVLLLSIFLLFAGYWFQDIIFSKNFSKTLSTLPEFINDLSVSKILNLIFPFIIAYFLFYLDDIILAHTFPVMETNVTKKILTQIFESIKTSKNPLNVNEIMFNVKNLTEIKNIYNIIVMYLLPTLIIGIYIFVYLFKNDKQAGLLLVVVLAIFAIINYVFEGKCINISNDYEKAVDVFYDSLQDVVGNYENVLTSNTCAKEIDAIYNLGLFNCFKHKKSEIVNSEITFGLSMLSMVLMFVIDGISFWMYKRDKIDIDTFITLCTISYVFSNYYSSSVFKFKNIIHYLGRYREMNTYFKRFELKEQTVKNIKVSNKSIVFSNVQPIHFSGSTSDRKTILGKEINVELEGNKKIAIIGEIGCGKSSVLKILCGLKTYKGDVYVDGVNFNDFSHTDIINNIIYVSQHPKLFNRTIFDNIVYGSNLTKKDLQKFVDEMELNEFFGKFKKGIYTMAGKDGNNLSGGQKQIISLLRAIMFQKPIILLDEPTSALDSGTKEIFNRLIKHINNKTVLVVTHDKTIYDLFDEIVDLTEKQE